MRTSFFFRKESALQKPPDRRLAEACLHILNFTIATYYGDAAVFAFGLMLILLKQHD